MPTNLEDRRAEVLATLAKCRAPREIIELAENAENAYDLSAIWRGYMFIIGRNMITAADALQSLGHQAEAARERLDAKLAMEPWQLIERARAEL